MISKKLFIETIDFIKKKREHESALIEALQLCSPHEYIYAFIYNEYEEQVIKLLHESLGLPKDDGVLEYWLWELNFGKDYTVGCFMDKEKVIDISTADKLYDFLTRKGKNNDK